MGVVILMYDKIYITGRKNKKEIYRNLLIIDRKPGLLKMIRDIVEPTTYHFVKYLKLY